jgi:putative NADH-flavin reductase
MKIGVSGASGHLGRAVVSEMLQRPGGHEVVAITRTPEVMRRFSSFAIPLKETVCDECIEAFFVCISEGRDWDIPFHPRRPLRPRRH